MNGNNGSGGSRFLRSSGLFLVLSLLGALFELGFNGVAARLPEGGFGVYASLFNVFFIVTVPLVSVQLMVSKEVSVFMAGGDGSRAHGFVRVSLRYALVLAAAVLAAGAASARPVAGFLRIGSATPVLVLSLIIAVNALFPILYGAIQGCKRFAVLGLLSTGWGLAKLLFASAAIFWLGYGLNGMLLSMVLAALATVAMAWAGTGSLRRYPAVTVSRRDVAHAYRFVLPIMASLFCVTVLRSMDMLFASRFYAPAVKDAYGAAVKVGQAFFTLTMIIMVMFPHVSEQRSLRQNPVAYLLKSLAVTVGLSLVGIAVCWVAPGLVMRIIMVGASMPGAEELIRVVGIVILPVSIMYIMANYFLAQHKAGFVPVLAGGIALQFVLIHLRHDTPLQLLGSVGAANLVTMLALGVFLAVEQRGWFLHERARREAAGK